MSAAVAVVARESLAVVLVPARAPVRLSRITPSAVLTLRRHVNRAMQVAADVDRDGSWARPTFNAARDAADRASRRCDITPTYTALMAWLSAAQAQAELNDAVVDLRRASDDVRALSAGYVDERVPWIRAAIDGKRRAEAAVHAATARATATRRAAEECGR